MPVSGLAGCPSRCLSVPTRGSRSRSDEVSFFSAIGRGCALGNFEPLRLQRSNGAVSRYRCSRQRDYSIKCAMDASYGDFTNESAGSNVFPRINVRDPYKRLGISREASEDEIQAARNFLVQKYAGHKPSLDAIESAHDKIIMQKFYERKNPKINVKKKVREVTQSRYVQAVMSRFQTPSSKFIIKTSIAFLVLGVLTVLFPTEEGPTLQCWSFHHLVVAGDLLDGFCDSTNVQGSEGLRSDDFIDNLYSPLGCLYLSKGPLAQFCNGGPPVLPVSSPPFVPRSDVVKAGENNLPSVFVVNNILPFAKTS
ncbi:hypothetical protein CDL15_Pgr013638 [Punica granatum]|uniref:Uncharacterized protein n=1 Tax=Punica granatum TaxID=22663 RepID=A0A218W2D9_PUNGR|nr:hypothetical protein CDL15_Pgr013638 [Punica granatum]